MNKNELLRKSKEKGIKEAIRYLHQQGVTDFSKKLIANTTKLLFPSDYTQQVNTNTLSKKLYYKDNMEFWIREITGVQYKDLEAARKNSLLSRQKKAKGNYKKIESATLKLANEIINGKIRCEKASKAFLTKQLMLLSEENNFKINQSTLSTEYYEPIYNKFISTLRGSINENSTSITLSDYSKLKEENKRLKEINNNLINDRFFIKDDHVASSVNNNVTSFNVQLDGNKLYHYFKLHEELLLNVKDLNAHSFFLEIVGKCQANKKH